MKIRRRRRESVVAADAVPVSRLSYLFSLFILSSLHFTCAIALGGSSSEETSLTSTAHFADGTHGRASWVVDAASLPWVGSYSFLRRPEGNTVLLSVVDSSTGISLGDCVAQPTAADESDDWERLVWTLSQDALLCTFADTNTTKIRFPLSTHARTFSVRIQAGAATPERVPESSDGPSTWPEDEPNTERFTVSPCAGVRCVNGGVCVVDEMARPRCLCPVGFSGPTCAHFGTSTLLPPGFGDVTAGKQLPAQPTATNPCDDLQCLHGGLCQVDVRGQAVCACPQTTTGVQCEVPVCATSCLNGGECRFLDDDSNGNDETQEGTTGCSCLDGFTGANCNLLDPCRINGPDAHPCTMFGAQARCALEAADVKAAPAQLTNATYECMCPDPATGQYRHACIDMVLATSQAPPSEAPSPVIDHQPVHTVTPPRPPSFGQHQPQPPSSPPTLGGILGFPTPQLPARPSEPSESTDPEDSQPTVLVQGGQPPPPPPQPPHRPAFPPPNSRKLKSSEELRQRGTVLVQTPTPVATQPPAWPGWSSTTVDNRPSSPSAFVTAAPAPIDETATEEEAASTTEGEEHSWQPWSTVETGHGGGGDDNSGSRGEETPEPVQPEPTLPIFVVTAPSEEPIDSNRPHPDEDDELATTHAEMEDRVDVQTTTTTEFVPTSTTTTAAPTTLTTTTFPTTTITTTAVPSTTTSTAIPTTTTTTTITTTTALPQTRAARPSEKTLPPMELTTSTLPTASSTAPRTKTTSDGGGKSSSSAASSSSSSSGAWTAALVVLLLLSVVAAAGGLVALRYVKRSRKLHGTYNPAREETQLSAAAAASAYAMPMTAVGKEERLI